MYKIRILSEAAHELQRLDRPVSQRVANPIGWLAENMESIRPTPLSGNLAGLFKLRVGDYRIVYEILHSEQVIVIHLIGHRTEIYRPR